MVINQGDVYWIDLEEPLGSEPGEGGVPKQSVVLVSQVFTVDKSQLGEYLGILSSKRVRQMLERIRLVIEPREI
jgi:mRNA interferase MazF